MTENEQAKAYAVRRAQRQNPHLEFETWEELMALPMNTVRLETFNELLESGLVEIREQDKPNVKKIEKKQKTPRRR